MSTAPEWCSCGRIMVGSHATESRNWNPDCRVHGLATAWWKSPEQRAKREADSERLRDLQQRAAAARKAYGGNRD